MRTILWFTALFAVSAFIFSATVNAANALAENLLEAQNDRISIHDQLR